MRPRDSVCSWSLTLREGEVGGPGSGLWATPAREKVQSFQRRSCLAAGLDGPTPGGATQALSSSILWPGRKGPLDCTVIHTHDMKLSLWLGQGLSFGPELPDS